MRIGLIVPGFSADANDWCIPALRNLVQALAATDDVWVLALRYPPTARRYSVFGAEVTALGGGTRRLLGSASLWAQAFAAIGAESRRGPFDALHAFWADETGAIATIAGRLLGAPTIVSLAGGEVVGFRDIGYGSQLTPFGRLKVATALRLAAAVTAGSDYQLGLARRWTKTRRPDWVRLIPLGVDLSLFDLARSSGPLDADATSPGADVSISHLIHVASLVPVKDQATLLRAAADAQERGARFILDIVGSGPLDAQLRKMAGQLNLAESVRFRGPAIHHELPVLYRSARAFLLSSRHEAQCLAALEAGACGVPTIGTAVGVIPELVPSAAISVPVGDYRSMGGAIATLLGAEGQLAALGRNARIKVSTDFALTRSSPAFQELYRDVTRSTWVE